MSTHIPRGRADIHSAPYYLRVKCKHCDQVFASVMLLFHHLHKEHIFLVHPTNHRKIITENPFKEKVSRKRKGEAEELFESSETCEPLDLSSKQATKELDRVTVPGMNLEPNSKSIVRKEELSDEYENAVRVYEGKSVNGKLSKNMMSTQTANINNAPYYLRVKCKHCDQVFASVMLLFHHLYKEHMFLVYSMNHWNWKMVTENLSKEQGIWKRKREAEELLESSEPLDLACKRVTEELKPRADENLMQIIGDVIKEEPLSDDNLDDENFLEDEEDAAPPLLRIYPMNTFF